jgi:hypothetical protein
VATNKTIALAEEMDIWPTTVYASSPYMISEGFSHIINLKDSSTDTIDYKSQWLCIDKYQKGEIKELLHDIHLGKAIAVSDGSYYEQEGLSGAAWIIASSNRTTFITATAIPPGTLSIQSAYRAELVGLLAVLQEILFLCIQLNLTTGTLTVYCNNINNL